MTYTLLGFQSTDTENGCDAERTADTIKEAKREARYMLSQQYASVSETDRPLAVVQIWKGASLIDQME